tara:strand:+ start:228 stop:770 length:543 start_codon:yes stop_codon:yes gene_type:complete
MTGYVYLIRIGDLYRIGSAKDLDKKLKKLNPDELITSLKTQEPDTVQARLLRKYRSKRIPETGYFNFNKSQLADCRNQLDLQGDLPQTLDAEISIGLKASLIVFILFLGFLIYCKVGIINSFAVSIGLCSLPMWFLVFAGNFGGYFVEDLNLFTAFNTRLKAFLLAFSMTSISFMSKFLF